MESTGRLNLIFLHRSISPQGPICSGAFECITMIFLSSRVCPDVMETVDQISIFFFFVSMFAEIES